MVVDWKWQNLQTNYDNTSGNANSNALQYIDTLFKKASRDPSQNERHWHQLQWTKTIPNFEKDVKNLSIKSREF